MSAQATKKTATRNTNINRKQTAKKEATMPKKTDNMFSERLTNHADAFLTDLKTCAEETAIATMVSGRLIVTGVTVTAVAVSTGGEKILNAAPTTQEEIVDVVNDCMDILGELVGSAA